MSSSGQDKPASILDFRTTKWRNIPVGFWVLLALGFGAAVSAGFTCQLAEKELELERNLRYNDHLRFRGGLETSLRHLEPIIGRADVSPRVNFDLVSLYADQVARLESTMKAMPGQSHEMVKLVVDPYLEKAATWEAAHPRPPDRDDEKPVRRIILPGSTP